MTTDSADVAAAALARLTQEGTVVQLADPMHIGVILDGSLEECARLARRVADLEERHMAALATIATYRRLGICIPGVVLDIEADLDPQNHPAA